MRDIVIEEFKSLMRQNIENIKLIVQTAEELKVTDEQFYIDYEIELSNLATKDHNIPS